MADTTLTFDQIDASLKKINLTDYQPGGRSHISAEMVRSNPAAALPQICPIYKAIRPILLVLASLPLIPPSWQTVIKTFLGVMDTICP